MVLVLVLDPIPASQIPSEHDRTAPDRTSTFLKEFSLNVKFFWLFLNCKRNDSHALVKTLVLTSRFYSSVVDGWSSFGFYGGYRLDLISGSCKRSFHGVCTSTHSFVGPMPAGADML